MELLELKRATFTNDKIVLIKKKGNITINIEDIERIEYTKPSLLNYLFASTWFGGTFPGRLQIYCNKKIKKTRLYLIRIKYKEVELLPSVYLKLIYPTL